MENKVPVNTNKEYIIYYRLKDDYFIIGINSTMSLYNQLASFKQYL